MANWTVSQHSGAETVGDNVDDGSMATYVDLTITPNVGYVISATDFKIGGATESPTNTWTGGNVDVEVYKVVFSDIGTAATTTNTVKARVHFAADATGGSSWVMPSANKDVYIDIDEKETITDVDRPFCITSYTTAATNADSVNKHTVTYASAPTNITTTNNTPLVHNVGNGVVTHKTTGTVVDNPTYPGAQVFQVTFATNTIYGYYYYNAPAFTLSGTNSNYYQVVASNQTYTSIVTGGVTANELTSIVYTVYYTPPNSTTDPDISNMCELEQDITFTQQIRQEDQGEPGAIPNITSTIVDTSNILAAGETRNINIYGDYTAQFYLQVVSSDSGKTYDFGPTSSGIGGTFTSGGTTMSELNTMGTNGNTQYPITFPSTSADLYYDIIIIPEVPTGTISPPVPIAANDMRIYQYSKVTVTLGINDSDSEYDDEEFPTAITIDGEAGKSLEKGIRKSFSYTITEAMVTDETIDNIAPKSSLDFTLDNQGSITTKTDSAPSSATFDVDSTTGIVAGNSINWEVERYPLFTYEEPVNSIIVGSDVDGDISVNHDNLVVGMTLSAANISSGVKIESVEGGDIILDDYIATTTGIPITFTADEVTVTDVDANGTTLTASQSLSGLTDDLDLSFGGGESDTSAIVVGATSVQSGDDVVISGTFIVYSFPTTNQTVKIDIDKLITITDA